MAKKITLSPEQWHDLKKIVIQGASAERRMGYPVFVENGDVSIEVDTEQT